VVGLVWEMKMIWEPKKLKWLVASGVAATMFSLMPAWAEESVTFDVPLKVSNLMDGVNVDVLCEVQDTDRKRLGGAREHVQPIDGSLETTVTVVVGPDAGKTFTTAGFWVCYMQVIKDTETVQDIVAHDPTGGPDDWKYAKPGTILTRMVAGRFEDN
jgi:hypothetical protein